MAVSVATRGGRGRGARAVVAALLLAQALGALSAAAAVPATAQPADPAGEAPAAPRGGEPGAAGGGRRAAAGPRALVAFLPARAGRERPLLEELAARGLATGLTSPTVGGYSPAQVALDISQGARLTGAAYPGPVGRLDLRSTDGSGRIEGWRAARARARAAPGEVVPGLLASAVDGAGGRAAYVGAPPPLERRPQAEPLPVRRPLRVREPTEEAVVAADRSGRVERASVGPAGTLARRALDLWRGSELVVARLPAGARGLAALDRMLAAAGRDDLVYVMQAPPPTMRLLPTGVQARGLQGLLSSDTTRRAGLVAAPDAAATVLRHLRIDPPPAVQGQALESAPGELADLRGLAQRLSVVVPRRGFVLPWLLAAWAALGAVLALAAGRAGARAALRVGLLAALWLPGIALLTAALRPGQGLELAILAGGGLGLGALTDRLVPWPAGPLVPAAATVSAHAVDLAAGSPLVATSLAGPNPLGGARFFGVGNELEAILSLTVLLGTGGALALAGDPRRAPRVFALACVGGAVIIGAGQLGAAVGGVITLGAGGAAAVLASLPGRPSRRAVALAVAAPVIALACLAAIDIATAGGAHLTREVLQGEGPGDLLDTLERRLDVSASGLEEPDRAIAVALAAVLLAAGLAARRRVLAPLDRAGPAAARAFRAALLGALVATVVGALANDSGPTIFLIGAVLIALAAGYAQGRPPALEAPSSRIARCA